jgi:hypothetical protein
MEIKKSTERLRTSRAYAICKKVLAPDQTPAHQSNAQQAGSKQYKGQRLRRGERIRNAVNPGSSISAGDHRDRAGNTYGLDPGEEGLVSETGAGIGHRYSTLVHLRAVTDWTTEAELFRYTSRTSSRDHAVKGQSQAINQTPSVFDCIDDLSIL